MSKPMKVKLRQEIYNHKKLNKMINNIFKSFREVEEMLNRKNNHRE